MKTKCRLIICNFAAAIALVPNPAFAADPLAKYAEQNAQINEHYREEVVGQYYSTVLKHIANINKQFLPADASHSLSTKSTVNNQPTGTSIPLQAQIHKTLDVFKNLIYNPENPGPFFDSLIALQTCSLGTQSQMIMWSEKLLGAKNAYVLGLKENYSRTLKYAEALEQQKMLLERLNPSLGKK